MKWVEIVYLCIDTDVLIFLALHEPPYEEIILQQLELLLEASKLELVVPYNILDEWNRNKELKVIDYLKTTISKKVNSIKDIKKYLSLEDYSQLENILSKYFNTMDTVIADATQRIERIDKILTSSKSNIVNINNEILSQSAELALQNKKPFQKNKNSIGDAVNFISCLTFARNNNQTVYFVTNNKHDFSDTDQRLLHSDLSGLLNNEELIYSINLVETLNKIDTDLFNKQLEDLINDFNTRPSLVYHDNSDIECGVCAKHLDYRKNGTYLPDPGGMRWIISCPMCNTRYETEELHPAY
ncbi:PIN domain-containing protein [Paenibacillus paeoniae]|uniref:DUF4935 domain-containing protein n=1 Tax=Paenibacillus paeoniae TaxID=2292705 RepID=A0A371P6H7_9BACL|nr:PIN domain-containing protein [Paenibacillus paeoniae]REK71485.1 DUF4935 domain-containing protein [Paenibacillus paeoniae]